MNRTLALAAILPALAACSTTTPAERLANNQASCQAYGFKAGTDGYANCMMQRDFADQEDDARRHAQIVANIKAMNDDREPRRTVTCNTYAAGQATNYGAVYNHATTTCR